MVRRGLLGSTAIRAQRVVNTVDATDLDLPEVDRLVVVRVGNTEATDFHRQTDTWANVATQRELIFFKAQCQLGVLVRKQLRVDAA